MKVTLILISLFLLSAGCFSTQDTAKGPGIEVVAATYARWSDPPQSGSDVPERGADLKIVVQNWPADYTPDYIVFNNRRSSSADILNGENTPGGVTITARIIQMSGLLQEQSGDTDRSDRLVFTTPDGKSNYIEIDTWHLEDD